MQLLLFFTLILFLKYRKYNRFHGWKWGVNLSEYDGAFSVLNELNQIRMNSIPAHPGGGPAEEAGAVPTD